MRSFPNKLKLENAKDSKVLDQILQSALRSIISAPKSRDFSVYTGNSGIAYALFRVSKSAKLGFTEAPESSHMLQLAREFSKAAFSELGTTQIRHAQALLGSEAGVHCVAAVACCDEEQPNVSAAVQAHLRSYQVLRDDALSCKEDEYLYGKAGWIQGALLLNKSLGAGTISVSSVTAVVEALLESGRRTARQAGVASPLFFFWHGRPYVGAAHGLIGICFVLLTAIEHGIETAGLREDTAGTLRYVLSLELPMAGSGLPSGHYPTAVGDVGREPLVHWCHGAPGAAILFCKAHQVLGGAEYLEAARRAGSVVWEFGLLRKGPGLCHGVAGNGYALLALYRCTGEERYYQQALQFGYFLANEDFLRESRVPDRPNSLYEGWAGAACFLADLQHPASSGFPMFEL